jgi:CRP-like cAMP-binding protein
MAMAFAVGLASAASLPLGTLTTALWRPSARVVALLMAFGGGALLAALTVDLVGTAVDREHFLALSVGMLAGGLLFDLLNHTVNSRGGFLRKSSTMIHYLDRQRRRRFGDILQDMALIDVFDALPRDEAEALASAVETWDYQAGEEVWGVGEPADALYVVDDGVVEIRPGGGPAERRVDSRRHGANDSLGGLAFFTGTPHADSAVAERKSRLWALPAERFADLLPACPTLARRLQTFLEGEEVADYLIHRHGLSAEAVGHWVEAAVTSLHVGEGIPDTLAPERDRDAFESRSDHVGRLPIFDGLTVEERDGIAERLFVRHLPKGETLFHQGEAADRLFIMERGAAVLVGGGTDGDVPRAVGEGDAFGGLSFLTRSPHTTTAVTTEDSAVWTLRRQDFDVLLRRFPTLGERVGAFLRDDRVRAYLSSRHNVETRRARRWMERAARSLAIQGNLPAAVAAGRHGAGHAGAPVAIWLGITLDGIPESLVLGSSMIHAPLSLSLVAGLFLSNYPEALSSSVGMREQGMGFGRVLGMWGSITLMTGIGAVFGNLLFVDADPALFSLVQGVAAGAMLTMIAETMLPEAYMRGGPASGFATLLGFLSAILVKALE